MQYNYWPIRWADEGVVYMADGQIRFLIAVLLAQLVLRLQQVYNKQAVTMRATRSSNGSRENPRTVIIRAIYPFY